MRTTFSTEVEIVNERGLHARVSARLCQLAGQYESEIWLERNGRRINAKSIMGVLLLGAPRGARLRLEAIGNDAEVAISSISNQIAAGFGMKSG